MSGRVTRVTARFLPPSYCCVIPRGGRLNVLRLTFKERYDVTHIQSRWQVVLVVLAVFFLLTLLPQRMRALPNWAPLLLTIALIAPMVALQFTAAKARWLRVERVVMSLFFVVVGFALAKGLGTLLYAMVSRSSQVSAIQLLASSIAGWVLNLLLFSLAYWRLDRGGPEARANNASTKADWLFPQQSVPEYAQADWQPTFFDYLFLAFDTATAFSPADAVPLSSRAKLLMMVESTISLVTVIAIAARAINILGS